MSVPAIAPETPTRGDPLAMRVLSWGILAICLFVWTVVGAFFWIPLLLRRIVTYSVALVPSTLTNRKPERSAARLRGAMSFYARGYKVTAEMVTRGPGRRERPGPSLAVEEVEPPTMPMVGEVLWAAVVWYAILFLLGVVHGTPLDLWRWVDGFPWGERVVDPAVDWLRAHRL